MNVPFSYLSDQFRDPEPILEGIRELVLSGDFTLGYPVPQFENSIAELTGCRHAVGVASGTDALFLSLKAMGVGPGDEVITACNTFYATAGAIAATGARVVFVDVDESFNIDAAKIESAVTKRTKALMPVHFMGLPANIPEVIEIARKRELVVVEDACQALGASIDGTHVGNFGAAGAFSFHPLKNLNVWGDAGMIVTNSDEVYEKLVLLRNHGLINRDEIGCFGYNSRLDALQAVVGNHLIKEFPTIDQRKQHNASRYDQAFAGMKGNVTLPLVRSGFKYSHHLYMLLAEKRDALHAFLQEQEIESKIHYPLPLHLQKPCRELGYKEGDFPVCESQCDHYITLPVHQHLPEEQVSHVIDSVKRFYSNG